MAFTFEAVLGLFKLLKAGFFVSGGIGILKSS